MGRLASLLKVGPYTIAGRLSERPHSSILQAFTESGERVAIKLLVSSEDDQGRQMRSRLESELAGIARLTHPNVVRLLDYGQHAGAPYLVMEYCDGLSVRDVLGLAGQFSVLRTLEIMSDVCRGLGAAHGQGIVHRDVKPGNVMLVRDGPAKLGDFGVAATREEAFRTPRRVVPGTVPYMSPEQTRGEVLDARSDVWAAGATMYEMLSGAKPFPGGNYQVIVRKIRDAEPRPLEGPAASIEPIVLKCLRKERSERYRSARELAGALHMSREELF